MTRSLSRRRLLGSLVRTGAAMGVMASLPAVLSWRRRFGRIRLAGTGVRMRIRPLGRIEEGRGLAG
jgi:hypothetical protein